MLYSQCSSYAPVEAGGVCEVHYKLEVQWRWKADRGGRPMEVEDQWKWKNILLLWEGARY